MAFLLLNGEEIASLLPMDECVEVMAEALRALARGEAVQPLRSVYWMPDRHGALAVMPGMLGLPGDAGDGGEKNLVAGVKVLTVIPDNRLHGEESHQGMVLLFEAERGKPVALLDATALTAIRTAAASAAATRALARQVAGDLAILGAGTQARSHLDAMAAVRTLRRVRVWSRRPNSARDFTTRETARTGFAVEGWRRRARRSPGGPDLHRHGGGGADSLRGFDAPGRTSTPPAPHAETRELDGAAVARSRPFTDAASRCSPRPSISSSPARRGRSPTIICSTSWGRSSGESTQFTPAPPGHQPLH